MYQKNVFFVIMGILKIFNLNLNRMFVITVVLGVSFRKQQTLQY